MFVGMTCFSPGETPKTTPSHCAHKEFSHRQESTFFLSTWTTAQDALRSREQSVCPQDIFLQHHKSSLSRSSWYFFIALCYLLFPTYCPSPCELGYVKCNRILPWPSLYLMVEQLLSALELNGVRYSVIWQVRLALEV